MLSTACWTMCNQHVYRNKKSHIFMRAHLNWKATPKSKYVANRIIITTTYWTENKNFITRNVMVDCNIFNQPPLPSRNMWFLLRFVKAHRVCFSHLQYISHTNWRWISQMDGLHSLRSVFSSFKLRNPVELWKQNKKYSRNETKTKRQT